MDPFPLFRIHVVRSTLQIVVAARSYGFMLAYPLSVQTAAHLGAVPAGGALASER